MKFDEQQHEISAKELGATELPKPIKKLWASHQKL